MEEIGSVEAMQKKCEDVRLAGRTIALVPTMGFLHEGHLELLRVGRKLAHVLIISIFVNPTQFGPAEDYEKYPRDKSGDLAKARKAGTDIAFTPSVEEMYPENFQTHISVERITHHLCGISRPGHFQGVATVVTKLFNITRPDFAVFGQKDFQQVAVIAVW